MGTTDFTAYEPGTDLSATFRSAQALARAESGHQEGYSGDIQAKTSVVLRHTAPMTRADANDFIFGTGAEPDGDLEQADREGACFAVPIRAATAPATIGYLFYGLAPC
ncbi:MAG: hypothetical protein WCI67_08990 [Chloroflexales bacterium]